MKITNLPCDWPTVQGLTVTSQGVTYVVDGFICPTCNAITVTPTFHEAWHLEAGG